jgi:hypothetical protein
LRIDKKKANDNITFIYLQIQMDTQVKQRVCGLLGGLAYVSTADVSY